MRSSIWLNRCLLYTSSVYHLTYHIYSNSFRFLSLIIFHLSSSHALAESPVSYTHLAAEGTDAHALCEYKLRKALGIKATDPTKSLNWYSAEMEDCATEYTSFIMELLEDAKQTLSLIHI